MSDKENISWEASEYQDTRKSPTWYFSVVVAVLALSSFALWRDNFFFGLFIILAGVMVVIFGTQKPERVRFVVSDEGIRIGDDIEHRYGELEGFDLMEKPNRLNEVIIKKATMLDPFLRIPLTEEVEDDVLEKLEENLSREEYEESLIDVVTESVGF